MLPKLRFSKSKKERPKIPLGWELLKDWCGKRLATSTRNSFEDSGVLRLKYDYFVDSHSKTFDCLLPLGGTPYVYELKTSRARGRLRDLRSKHRAENEKELPLASRIQVNFLREISTEFDPAQVNRAVEELADHPKSTLVCRYAADLLTGCWSGDEEKAGRLHTPFTRMPSAFRWAFPLDGERPVQIDVTNANPLILASGLCDELPLQSQGEGELFLDLCEDGSLYEFLTNLTNLDRDDAKHQFQMLLNDDRFQGNDVSEAFRTEFPEIHKWIVDYKLRKGRAAIQERCARRESAIVLPLVAELICKGISAISIHDAILTSKRYALEVADRLADAIEKKLGTGCTLKLSNATKEIDVRQYRPQALLVQSFQ